MDSIFVGLWCGLVYLSSQSRKILFHIWYMYGEYEFVTYTPPPSFMNSLQAGGKCKITIISDLFIA